MYNRNGYFVCASKKYLLTTMQKTIQTDYLIVGQGIAGTCLAHQLIKTNLKVLVIDNAHINAASKVAAGLYNPIVFKRLTNSWLAEMLINYLGTFYNEIEILLNTHFHTKKNIVKLFTNNEEIKLWQKKCKNNVFLDDDISTNYTFKNSLQNNLGVSKVMQSGAVDVNKLVTLYREYLKRNDLLIEEKFDYTQLISLENSVEYKNIEAANIVFCEGANAIENPYFPINSFKLTHGEILEIEANNLPEKDVINKGVFILPIHQKNYKVGATYEWDNISGMPTEKGLQELTSKLNSVINVEYKIVNHKAGIRPTVVDRRPLLGAHTTHKNIFFFNGMGTKGVMLAPYFSERMMGFLHNKEILDPEIDIKRYF